MIRAGYEILYIQRLTEILVDPSRNFFPPIFGSNERKYSFDSLNVG